MLKTWRVRPFRGSVVIGVQFSTAGRALAAQSQQALGAAEPQPTLERSLVGQIVAKNDIAANVTSLRTADEALEKLVRLGDGGR
jgi:hypothetical protein